MSIKVVNNQKGIGLVETILALGISVVVVTSLVSLAVYTLRSSQESKFLLEGSKLAAEQIELLRVVKDKKTTWAEYKTALTSPTLGSTCLGSTHKCYTDSALNGFVSGEETLDVSNSSHVARYFYFTYPSSPDENVIRVTSVVTWEVGPPPAKTTTVVTDITNWKNQ